MPTKIAVSFIIGFFIYCLGAFLSNSNYLKATPYYYYLAIGAGAVANYIWFSIAKSINQSGQIIILGLFWDLMIVAAFILVPVLFFDINLRLTQIIGCGIMILGFILTKV